MYKASLDALRVPPPPLPRYPLGTVPFRFPVHINNLEAQALLSYIRWCVREGRVSQRIIVAVGSGGGKGSGPQFRAAPAGSP